MTMVKLCMSYTDHGNPVNGFGPRYDNKHASIFFSIYRYRTVSQMTRKTYQTSRTSSEIIRKRNVQ